MPRRELDRENLATDEDWVGNNAAFTCPHCRKVFLVSGLIHRGTRSCPSCAKSTGRCEKSGKTWQASLEW